MTRLVGWLLDLVYLTVLVGALPWLLYKAATTRKYRSGLAQKLLGLVPRRSGNRPCIWLHAVSVGEVNLLPSMLSEIARLLPDAQCVISTTTLTGYSVACANNPGRTIFYLPLDFSWAVRRALSRIRPDLVALAELELWPNLILAARNRGIAVAVFNGRLSDRSYRGYRRLRPLVAPVLRSIDFIAAQTPQYAERFLALGARPDRVRVTGSIKFDGTIGDRNNPATQRLARLAGFDASDVVFMAGSTGAPEEALALAAFQHLSPSYPELRLVLVPRHPERFDEVARLLTDSGIDFQRRSALGTASASRFPRVLLVDCVGELSAWWGTADIAFVGGSLNRRGGQNMIEPAAYGAAICFGPNTRNFRDIVALLLDQQAARVVQDGQQLLEFVERSLADRAWAAQLGRQAQQVVRTQQGATRRTIELLLPLCAISQRQPPLESRRAKVA